MKLPFSIAFTKHTYTYRRRNPKQIEGLKRWNHKVMNSTLITRAGSVFWVDLSENQSNSYKTTWKGRGLKYEQSPTWITQFRLRMRKLWCLEVEKIGEKNIDGISQFFFLETNGGNWRDLKRMRRRAFLSTKFRDQASHPTCGARVPHVARELAGPCGTRPPHVEGLPWPLATKLLPRTSHVLQPYSGIRTPISNPFLDYESWLPHAQRRLWNFDKWLRIHLGKWRRTQLNEWERKVA